MGLHLNLFLKSDFLLTNFFFGTVGPLKPEGRKKTFQGTLVPKLTIGPFLKLSVRNGHTL